MRSSRLRLPPQLCASRTLPGLQLPANSEWSLYCADLRTKYVAMAYYALTTLVTAGYGDIVPGTNMERCCTMVLELGGCVACGVVFGNMALLLHTFDAAGARLQKRLAELRQVCRHYRVPRQLARRAASSAAETWKMHRGVDMRAVWEALPSNLHAEVLLHLRGDQLRTSPLLRGCGDELLKALAQKAQPHACTAGEALLSEQRTRSGGHGLLCGAASSPSSSLIFVVSGRLQLRRQGRALRTLAAGDTFGEEALCGGRHPGCELLSLGESHLLTLPASELTAALKGFPEERQGLRERAVQLWRRRMDEEGGDTLSPADKAARGEGEAQAGEEEQEQELAHGAMMVDETAPSAALAHKLLRARKLASAQQRVVRSRLSAAMATYAALEEQLESRLAKSGEAARAAWLSGGEQAGSSEPAAEKAKEAESEKEADQ